MYANTLTLTIDSVARTLTRKNQDNFGSFYSFLDGTEEITMKIRHDKEDRKGIIVNRHNVFIEHTVFATPLTFEKYWSATVTLRDRKGSGPVELLELWVGASALIATLDDSLVTGDN